MPTKAAKPVRLFLVDDHAMVRAGLVTVLKQSGFGICGQAGSLQEALAHPGLNSADLVLVDLSLGAKSGLELIKNLQERRLRSLVYSMHEDSNVVRKAFAAGAAGYVTKREAASCLVEAVHSVLAGNRYVSPRAGIGLVARGSADAEAHPSGELSEQQQRLYELLGEGFSGEEIAEVLHVSPRTVESYAARMMEKLNVAGMKELRRAAIAERLRIRGQPD
ncbi:MAG TPA: response regulator transcription factor [Candidatus Paceibacterota bacterium]|nr:response regulator transcription factor [Verrucomicrobiota bacterium]HRZ44828.1 response regulator transcription factor [Candidatus Paceibacterota bacterium]HRZ93874.1 response regulator transcription factor [Candidatus Paceibacterota bacterium]